MKVILSREIQNAIYDLIQKCSFSLPADYKKELECFRNFKGIKLIFENEKIAKQQKIPLCQDTGQAIFFFEIGENVFIKGGLIKSVNEGVKKAYNDFYLRKSVKDITTDKNTKTNIPAVIHLSYVKGDKVKIYCMLKGGGSENVSVFKMFNPSEDLKEIKTFIVEHIKKIGANACPPYTLGIGMGGNFEQSALNSKLAPLKKSAPAKYKKFLESLKKEVNKLKIGALGLKTGPTCIGTFLIASPSHIASLPVSLTVMCHSFRHAEKILK